MTKRKSTKVSESAKHLYEQILQCQKHINNIVDARYFVSQNGHRDNLKEFAPALDVLREKELSMWRMFAMIGLYLPEDEQERIKAAVHERFFIDDMVIGTHWLACSAEEFRTALTEMCLPDDIHDEVVAVMAKRRLTHGSS